MGALPEETRNRMGARSHQLSKQFTPSRWAETLVSEIRQLNEQRSGE
jgi:hypothetical protein